MWSNLFWLFRLWFCFQSPSFLPAEGKGLILQDSDGCACFPTWYPKTSFHLLMSSFRGWISTSWQEYILYGVLAAGCTLTFDLLLPIWVYMHSFLSLCVYTGGIKNTWYYSSDSRLEGMHIAQHLSYKSFQLRSCSVHPVPLLLLLLVTRGRMCVKALGCVICKCLEYVLLLF